MRGMSTRPHAQPIPLRLGALAPAWLPARVEARLLAGLSLIQGDWRRCDVIQTAWAAWIEVPQVGALALAVEGLGGAAVAVSAARALGGRPALAPIAGSAEPLSWVSAWRSQDARVSLGASAEARARLWAREVPAPRDWPKVLHGAELAVTVEVGRATVPLATVDGLQVGAVLRLGPRGQGFSLRVEGTTTHQVLPVRRGDRLGCRVMDGPA